MNEEIKCCGNCRWRLRVKGEWTCGNNECDYYGLEVTYEDDECEEWEGRQ